MAHALITAAAAARLAVPLGAAVEFSWTSRGTSSCRPGWPSASGSSTLGLVDA
jgi:hypothetical protein